MPFCLAPSAASSQDGGDTLEDILCRLDPSCEPNEPNLGTQRPQDLGEPPSVVAPPSAEPSGDGVIDRLGRDAQDMLDGVGEALEGLGGPFGN
jgi:hypothetical protein